MVKWCGNCGKKLHECDNAMYMECTSQPFKLWTPEATCNNCAMRNTSKCSNCVSAIINEDGTLKGIPSEWQPITTPSVSAAGAASSPARGEPSGEAKWDTGKLELDLVPLQIVRDIAEVRMYGTAKYGDPNNWQRVEMRRYVNALLRHMVEFVSDYDSVDEESGIPHYKHMECNMAFISEMMRTRKAVAEFRREVGLDG